MKPTAPETDFYKILQVDRRASTQVIQSAYRALLKSGKHPDLGGSAEHAQAINEAYAVLTDPDARREYDRQLAEQDAARNGRLAPAQTVLQYILICPSCKKGNVLRERSAMGRARCGNCGRPLLPRSRLHADGDDARAFRLGIFLFDKGLYDRAAGEFRTATRLKPGEAKYQYWLGRCLYQKRDFTGARTAFRAAVHIRPRRFHYQFWLGQTSYALQDYPAALAGFSRAHALRRRHAPTLMRLSSCHFRLSEFEHAVTALEAAIQMEPRRVEAYNWLGVVHLASGDVTAARTAFERAERLQPGNRTTQKYLRLCRQEATY